MEAPSWDARRRQAVCVPFKKNSSVGYKANLTQTPKRRQTVQTYSFSKLEPSTRRCHLIHDQNCDFVSHSNWSVLCLVWDLNKRSLDFGQNSDADCGGSEVIRPCIASSRDRLLTRRGPCPTLLLVPPIFYTISYSNNATDGSLFLNC